MKIRYFLLLCLLSSHLSGFGQISHTDSLKQALVLEHYPHVLRVSDSLLTASVADSGQLYYLQSIAYERLNNPSQAIACMLQALPHDSLNTQWRFRLGKLYYQAQRYSLAAQELEPILETDSAHLQAGLYLGRIYNRFLQYDKALALYNQLARHDTTRAIIYRNRAIMQVKLQTSKKAVPDFQRAIALDSTDMTSLTYLARIYQELDRFDEALALMQQVKQADPGNPEVYKTIGDIHYHRHHHYRALPAYAQAWQKGFRRPDIAYRMGVSSYQTNQLQRSIGYLRAGIPLGDDGNMSRLLGFIYHELEQTDSSNFFLQQGLQIMQPDPKTVVMMRIMQSDNALAQGNYEKALHYLNEAMEADIEEPFLQSSYRKRILIRYAQLYDKHLSQPQNALTYYQQTRDTRALDKEERTWVNARIARLKEDLFFEDGASQ